VIQRKALVASPKLPSMRQQCQLLLVLLVTVISIL